MPKNFDEKREQRSARDRTFVLGGEQFELRSGVRPEALVPYETLDTASGSQDAIDTMDKFVLDFIVPDGDAADRWKALRARDDDPVTIEDLGDLVSWITEEVTGRPTGQGSDSSGSPAENVTPLKDASSSKANPGFGPEDSGFGELTIRQVCNLAHAYAVEAMTGEERVAFDAELVAAPFPAAASVVAGPPAPVGIRAQHQGGAALANLMATTRRR